MPQVGILTLHFNYNYGAVLQAYAMARAIGNEGYTPFFPSYIPPYMRGLRSSFKGLGLRSPKTIPRALHRAIHRLRTRSRRKTFELFREQNLPSHLHDTPETILQTKDLSALIVGSDQVWNTNFMADYEGYHFLDFLPEKSTVRRIAYAPCFGQKAQNPEVLEKVRPYLARFDHIGVRNKLGQSFVRELTNREVQIVADPTFLHDFKEFSGQPRLAAAHQPYVLFYSIDEDSARHGSAIAERIATNLNLPVIQIAAEHATIVERKFCAARDVSPDDWVRLFRNAEAIVTDSFHGCVFGIKFARPFLAYTTGWRSTRLQDLLGSHGLSERLLLRPTTAFQRPITFSPNEIDSMNTRRTALVGESKEFLRRALAGN